MKSILESASATGLGGAIPHGKTWIAAHRTCKTVDPTREHECTAEQDHGGAHRCLCGDEWWRE